MHWTQALAVVKILTDQYSKHIYKISYSASMSSSCLGDSKELSVTTAQTIMIRHQQEKQILFI